MVTGKGACGMCEKTTELKGVGLTATIVANSILRRAFADKVDVTPMKLQKLLFFTTCLYQRRTGRRLLVESFQPWRYGPVVQSVYDEFKRYRARPIDRYAMDATGHATAVTESSSRVFRWAINTVWGNMRDMTAVELSRLTHVEGSAWSQAVAAHARFISNAAMAGDHTFDEVVGL